MEEIHINTAEIPEHVYDWGCRVLYHSVTAALEDPALRAEYKAWKAARDAAGKDEE